MDNDMYRQKSFERSYHKEYNPKKSIHPIQPSVKAHEMESYGDDEGRAMIGHGQDDIGVSPYDIRGGIGPIMTAALTAIASSLGSDAYKVLKSVIKSVATVFGHGEGLYQTGEVSQSYPDPAPPSTSGMGVKAGYTMPSNKYFGVGGFRKRRVYKRGYQRRDAQLEKREDGPFVGRPESKEHSAMMDEGGIRSRRVDIKLKNKPKNYGLGAGISQAVKHITPANVEKITAGLKENERLREKIIAAKDNPFEVIRLLSKPVTKKKV